MPASARKYPATGRAPSGGSTPSVDSSDLPGVSPAWSGAGWIPADAGAAAAAAEAYDVESADARTRRTPTQLRRYQVSCSAMLDSTTLRPVGLAWTKRPSPT